MTNDNKPPNLDYILATKLFKVFREVWLAESKEAGVDAVHHAQMSVVALAQLTAIIAVDINMPQEAFVSVCRATFDQAYRNAPKFG